MKAKRRTYIESILERIEDLPDGAWTQSLLDAGIDMEEIRKYGQQDNPTGHATGGEPEEK